MEIFCSGFLSYTGDALVVGFIKSDASGSRMVMVVLVVIMVIVVMLGMVDNG